MLGKDWQDHDLVFASEHGTPTSPRNLYRQFESIRYQAGLGPKPARRKKKSGSAKPAGRKRQVIPDQSPVILHDLRRTFATLLGEEVDTEERVIGAILGHGARSVTQK